MSRGLALAAFLAFSCSQAADLTLKNAHFQAFFPPDEGADATEAVVQTLNAAHREVLVQAYSFTSALIAGALRDAHRRGVRVCVILDKSQRSERYSSMDFLVHAGVPVWIDAAHPIAHNKVMLVDGEIFIGGSFNFTKGAERNAENLQIIRDRSLVALYRSNWEAHLQHSEVAQ